ncbi:endoplasmic reticulum metallopeptidase 1 isoform X2 [Lepisosteus oculatus]|uniref:endoplasmic reticulum metallopeptidase 1 isoform X2 n=1 Tax=Lepisosteus oculatus TaxID=7918 RepID=UPI00371F19F1
MTLADLPAVKMERDTTVRRIKGYRTCNNISEQATDTWELNENNDSGEDKKKLELGLCLLEEGIGVGLAAIFLFVLWGLVHLSLQQLVIRTSTDEFNAIRARKHLEHITSVGPRPVGSPENEVLTVNYLLSQIEKIKAESASGPHSISVDIQRPTGSFSIDFLGGFTSYYDKVTNIAVKLEPKQGAKHAMLANCHFDSVANSPGASDDAVSCAVMLEVLQSLSSLSTPLQHAVIFLFNGAEENVLQASHGFITQHPWAKLIRAFINLEAAGVGGKEIVFQTGPENPWLVQAYVHAAKHPFASVVGQEVFQSGIIPSDTDFRIYRDFGNIPGIDLAFIESGFIYHTKYDTPDRILTDSIQRAGDNILAVVKHLALSDKLADSSEYRHGNMVFFDLLGIFVVAYPARMGTIINYMVAVATFIYLGKKYSLSSNAGRRCVRELAYAVGVAIMSWFITLLSVLIVALLVSLMGKTMFWYNHFYVSICLYGSAAAGKMILIHTLAKNLYYGLHFIYLVRSTKKVLAVLGAVFAVVLVLVSCGLFFPYSDNPSNPRPKRVFLQHTTRMFHDVHGQVERKDSGVWINGFDYTGMRYITPHIPEINDTIRAKCEDSHPFCGFPWFLPVRFLVRKNWYLPAPEVSPKMPLQFQLVSREETDWGTTKLSFEVTGPCHMSLYLRPHSGTLLSGWSFGDFTPQFGLEGEYFIFYSHGLDAPAWKFWIEVQAPKSEFADGMITVAIASHYFFGEDQKTPQLADLLDRFPVWTFPSYWVSTYNLYKY